MNFPDILPESESFDLQANNISYVSPYNNAAQTARLNGEKWVLSASFANRHKDNDGRQLIAFIRGLGGQNGRFDWRPSDWEPMGTPTGTPLVNGAGQLGTSLVTDGWDVSTNIFKAGDYFNVNGELKQVTSDATSDASGNATIEFTPPLRRAPSDNAPLNVTDPRVTMRLVNDSNPFQVSGNIVYSINVNAEEVINL